MIHKQILTFIKILIKNYQIKKLIIIEIKNPKVPSKRIPIAEIFATEENSFFVGFFKTSQTLFDFSKKALS